MFAAVTLVCFFAFVYSVIMLLLAGGLNRLDHHIPVHQTRPVPVTMIIPFRNEEDHLPHLVKDILSQLYPKEQLEVIFVNDHSGDRSREKIQSLVKGDSRFRCLDLPEGRSGKKDALFTAVQEAGGQWIIQTDADCRIGPRFVASHVAFLRQHPSDLVAGIVTTGESRGGFTEFFERLDLLSLVAAGAGSFHYGRPVMCSGANLAYTRDLYLETRKFDPATNVASGDDMFLMIGARRLGKKISFISHREAMVKTIPADGLRYVILQRVRWGSKTWHYGMTDIQLLAVLVAATNLLIISIPVWLILQPSSWICLVPAWGIKTLADFFLLYTVTGLTRQRKALRLFLPAALFYYFYHLIILTGMLVSEKGWKGRRY